MIIVINENDSTVYDNCSLIFVKYLTRLKYININNNNQITLLYEYLLYVQPQCTFFKRRFHKLFLKIDVIQFKRNRVSYTKLYNTKSETQ